jgi:hypothetical protein
MVTEIFIASPTIENFTCSTFIFFPHEWVERAGVGYAYLILGGASLTITATIPIVLVFGEKSRSFWQDAI